MNGGERPWGSASAANFPRSRAGVGARSAFVDREDDYDEEDEEERTIPVTARALQAPAPGAWQIFLDYAGACFPLISASGREDVGIASLGRKEGLEGPTAAGEAELLRVTCDQVSQATLVALRQIRRLGKGPMPTAARAPLLQREACEFQALSAGRELELAALRRHNDSLLEVLGKAISCSSKVNEVLCELRSVGEELANRRVAREKAAKEEAEQTLGPLEATCARLRELQARKAALLERRRFRTCRAEEVNASSGEALLIFRGRHRLRVRPVKDAVGKAAESSSLCLRFEPCLPGHSSQGVESELLERFEELLCRIWLRALDPQLHALRGHRLGATAVAEKREVPNIVRLLDVSFLDAADLVKALAKALRSQRQLASVPLSLPVGYKGASGDDEVTEERVWRARRRVEP